MGWEPIGDRQTDRHTYEFHYHAGLNMVYCLSTALTNMKQAKLEVSLVPIYFESRFSDVSFCFEDYCLMWIKLIRSNEISPRFDWLSLVRLTIVSPHFCLCLQWGVLILLKSEIDQFPWRKTEI